MTSSLLKLNFRDIGGYAATGKWRVREGLVFRSEGPINYSDNHLAELSALGVRSICDLRSTAEIKAAPHVWVSPDCRMLNFALDTDVRAQGGDVWERLTINSTPAVARDIMIGLYRKMPEALTPHISHLVATLIDGETPMIINCTAGKDRTGFLVALLLELLGVSRESIVLDYMRSEIFGSNMRATGTVEQTFVNNFGFIPSEPVMSVLIGTDPDFLVAAMEEIEIGWGSVANYFSACGIGADHQRALRDVMLEPQ